jgi:hypothetical protein
MPELRLAEQPPTPGPRDEVHRLQGGEEFSCIILSPKIWGPWTHWTGERSQPCYEPKNSCPGCQKGLPSRWKGYIHVIDIFRRKECFLELTPKSAELLTAQKDPDQDLRGLSFTLQRGKGSKAKLSVRRTYGRTPDNQMPPARDPEPVIRLLWNMPSRQFSQGSLEPWHKEAIASNGEL